MHQLIGGPQRTFSRGLLSLCSFRDNAPDPQEAGGPREFRGQVGWGGNIHMATGEGEEVWDVQQSEGRRGLAGWGIKYGVYKNNYLIKTLKN